jgi:tight adherence protein C
MDPSPSGGAVIEPILAAALTAVGVASGIAGVARARGREEASPGRVVGSSARRHLPWLAAGVVALVLPGPRVVTVPATILLVLRARRLIASRTETRRLRAIDAEIPQLLDLLAAGSAAGFSAPVALGRAVPALRGPLGGELRACLDAVALGARWRQELDAVTRRLALPDLRRAFAVLGRTETLGSSLTTATRELAADVRAARRAVVSERARAAPVKMLFPLVFLVLPAFLLLTVVPVLLTTVRSIR